MMNRELEKLYATAMVEEETRRYRPTKNYLENLPAFQINIFETAIVKNEFERLQNRFPMDVLSMKRYELPPPVPGKMSDLIAWNESVENSFAQLEHQATRINNLQLMVLYGSEMWKSYLNVLIRLINNSQKQIQELRKLIQEINWQRKANQIQGGQKLKEMESQWVGLVSKNYEIEQACVSILDKIKYEIFLKSNVTRMIHE
ncbi:pre-mRNA-splicing factor SPF27 isoform X2 [Phymastichus coffea]|uniref:pre-mRNA-splicing factor SPF27 isoform X2 n=1 Tax=Phymastichus coffea TaxID=108790 RepID=UPI00273B6CA4|nr:pre-mRNA-splicing factor SPF27 isoform X2 [Phymastichus coffea]